MKGVYRTFAYLIATLVVVQAAAIAYAVFGLTKYVSDGHVVDKASMESDTTTFDGVLGFAVHGIGGTMVIPLVAILFVIVSLFAKVPGGIVWALVTFVVVAVQVLRGIFAHDAPALGAVHGLLALVLFGVAVTAGMRVKRVTAGTSGTAAAVSTPAG